MNFHSIYCGNGEPHNPLRLGICKRWPQRSRCEWQERRQWRERNQPVIKRLSQMVGAWPQDIEDFLYDLTLQKYRHLLNPRECGWSFCKVPLCYPNICDRYMGIFDRLGNLRDPTHPKCLLHLLSLLQDHLNGACQDGCLGLPIHAEYPGGRPSRCRRFRNLLNFHDPELEGIDEHNRAQSSLASALDGPSLRRTLQMKRKPPVTLRSEVTPIYSTNNSPRMSVQGPYNLQTNNEANVELQPGLKFKKTLTRHSVFLNDELALAHNRPHYYIEDLLRQALGRPHNRTSYVGPVGFLRTERLRILIKQLVDKKGRNIDPEELKIIIGKVNLGPHIEKKRQRELALEVSRLYSSVVQRQTSNSISKYITPAEAKRTKRSVGHLSIKYHEPRESSKPYRPRPLRLSQKHLHHHRSVGGLSNPGASTKLRKKGKVKKLKEAQ